VQSDALLITARTIPHTDESQAPHRGMSAAESIPNLCYDRCARDAPMEHANHVRSQARSENTTIGRAARLTPRLRKRRRATVCDTACMRAREGSVANSPRRTSRNSVQTRKTGVWYRYRKVSQFHTTLRHRVANAFHTRNTVRITRRNSVRTRETRVFTRLPTALWPRVLAWWRQQRAAVACKPCFSPCYA
jgi:hypothetical protein